MTTTWDILHLPDRLTLPSFCSPVTNQAGTLGQRWCAWRVINSQDWPRGQDNRRAALFDVGRNGGGEVKQMFALAGEGKRGCGCQPHHHLMLGNSCPNTSGKEKQGWPWSASARFTDTGAWRSVRWPVYLLVCWRIFFNFKHFGAQLGCSYAADNHCDTRKMEPSGNPHLSTGLKKYQNVCTYIHPRNEDRLFNSLLPLHSIEIHHSSPPTFISVD